MIAKDKHISVCICTFKRPYTLKLLLNVMEKQKTDGLFSYSVVISDNDSAQSAKEIVSEFAAKSSLPVTYCVEPEQNISLARNRALETAKGDFIGFIDDDELPEEDWLYNLYKTCIAYSADGVLGPVSPCFEQKPPKWAINGRIFERPTYETGYKLSWAETRTGNLLFRREILNGVGCPFRPEFGTGSEDVDFFRRMNGAGKVFVWCNEAVVYELVAPGRCTRSYQIRLALLRGGNSLKHREVLCRMILTSLIAVPLYLMALPFLWVAGDHYFMQFLIKLSDHAGRLLALLGVHPVKARPDSLHCFGRVDLGKLLAIDARFFRDSSS